MLATMAEGLSKDQVKMFEDVMKSATDEAGTAVHADGRPFSAELFIEAIEKMELSFDDDGNWEMPTLVGHPMHEARIKSELARLDATPKLHAEATAIVIREYSDRWHAQGHGSLVVWQKTELLQKFIAAHGSYIASSLTDFRSFVELYVADFSERLPRRRFADFAIGLYPSEGTALQKKRALHSAILTGHYVVAQYETAQNYVAALEGWTILAMLVMHAVERDGLDREAYQPMLGLIATGFDRVAASFLKEVVESEHFVSPRLTIADDPEVRAARTMLVLETSVEIDLLRLHSRSGLRLVSLALQRGREPNGPVSIVNELGEVA